MASETSEPREKSLNFLEEIIEESIAKGEKHIQTRFPPEPNGYLHIGHAKSICINFGLAKKYGGKCNLRFDDTNPVKEDVEYVDSIKRDIQWLGFQWELERYASDYFDQLYEWAIVLIKKGLAYVDDQTQEQIRENRGTVSVPGEITFQISRCRIGRIGLQDRRCYKQYFTHRADIIQSLYAGRPRRILRLREAYLSCLHRVRFGATCA